VFQRFIDDIKDATGTAVRMTSLAVAAAVALLITTGFLCAAAFVFVLERYGPVQACLTGAAIFFVVTLVAAGSYMARKKQAKRASRRQRNRPHLTCSPIPPWSPPRCRWSAPSASND
jgi:hypothetical protein